MTERVEPIGVGEEETKERDGAFPRLDDAQLERLRKMGRAREVEAGEVLFRAGDETTDFFVVESGAVAIVQGLGRGEPGHRRPWRARFLGELSLLIGQRLYLSGVVRDAGEIIQIPLGEAPRDHRRGRDLSDVILGAFIARRSILIGAGTGMKLIGSRFSPDSHRLREFLARNRMPYQWIDLERDERGGRPARGPRHRAERDAGRDPRGGEILRNPSNAELGRRSASVRGLAAAALRRGRRRRRTRRARGRPLRGLGGPRRPGGGGDASGGQAGTSAQDRELPRLSGGRLRQRADPAGDVQAGKFGARLNVPAAARRAAKRARPARDRALERRDGDGPDVIVATGAQYRRLDVPRLDEFEGGGVYYAATQAEAQLCAGDPVVIVGGGNSAGQAAMFLSRHAAQCRLLIRGGDLGKSMSRYLVDQIERNDVDRGRAAHAQVVELDGERELEGSRSPTLARASARSARARALFVFIGASPHTEWLEGQLATDGAGFLLTGRDVDGRRPGRVRRRPPLFLETSRPGIFAVGDVHAGSIKRVASAVGEGSMAVRLVHQRLASPVTESTPV